MRQEFPIKVVVLACLFLWMSKELRNYLRRTAIGFQLAFPDYKKLPAQCLKGALGSCVPLSIPGELRFPIFAPGAGHPPLPASWVLVPEASVNEDHLPAGRKYQVRFAWKVFAVESEAVADAVEQLAEKKLGGGVF
jgi:hypothetical protein